TNLLFLGFNFTNFIFSGRLIVFVVGAFIYINSNDRAGLIIMLVGLIFLISKYFYFNVWTLWPVLLIILGLYILFNIRRSPRIDLGRRVRNRLEDNGQALNEDYIDDIAVFSGSKRFVTSQNFKGGKITAIFGGSEIDLGQSRLAPGNNVLDILTIFGGTEIYVPKDWKVIMDITPVFGGFSDDRRRDPNQVTDPERTLIIKGSAIFGGGEIKTA
ncbi:MAG: LiaF domain-containing protein, partial [Bacillota bacterium]